MLMGNEHYSSAGGMAEEQKPESYNQHGAFPEDHTATLPTYHPRAISPEPPEFSDKADRAAAQDSEHEARQAIITKLRLIVLGGLWGLVCLLTVSGTGYVFVGVDSNAFTSTIVVSNDGSIGSIVVAAAIVWEAAGLITLWVRKRPIHHMAYIVLDFLLFLAALTLFGMELSLFVVPARLRYYSRAREAFIMASGIVLSGLYLALFIFGVKKDKSIKRARKLASAA